MPVPPNLLNALMAHEKYTQLARNYLAEAAAVTRSVFADGSRSNRSPGSLTDLAARLMELSGGEINVLLSDNAQMP